MNLDEWDQRHRQARLEPPLPLLVRTASRLAPGRALDLACGTGRHALWLAGQGWSVTAVDGSRAAIEILRERAGRLPVEAMVADLEKHEYRIEPSQWDLIVVSHYFQRDLIETVKQGVVPGGVVVMIALMSGRYAARPGELAECFDDWEVQHYREAATAELAARRVGAATGQRNP